MSTKSPSTRPNLLVTPWLAMLACFLFSAPVLAAEAPTPLAAVASGTLPLQTPAPAVASGKTPLQTPPPAVASGKPQLRTPPPAVASGAPQLRMPKGEPQKLVWQAPAKPGAKTMARGEGKVAADRPVLFVFRPEVGGLHSIGVSSPGSAARIAIYLDGSTTPATGTTPTDGAIRWSSDIATGAAVKILVYTAGAEIPFRIEAHGGPGSV